MTTPFLESLAFLTPEQRAALAAQDLDTPDAFRHYGPEHFTAPPFGYTAGKAGKLIAAARAADAQPASAPQAVTVNIAEPPPRSARIDAALQVATRDPSRAVDLLDLGVDRVVLSADDRIDVVATGQMRVHASGGASVGPTWQGQRVADVRRLSTPPVWCSPRTGRPLQAGRDELDPDIAWGELRLDGLRLTAFAEREGMLANKTDEAVLAGMRPGQPLRAKVEARMRAMEVAPESMDSVVVYQPHQRIERVEVLRAPAVQTSNKVSDLANFFLRAFASDELRRFLGYGPEGSKIASALPGVGVSSGQLAHAAADILCQLGHTSDPAMRRSLRDRLVAIRPRRVDEIDALLGE